MRLARVRSCTYPREPVDVVRAPLGPVPGLLHVSTANLANERITLTASKTRRVRFGSLEAGTLTHRSARKLTLERVAD